MPVRNDIQRMLQSEKKQSMKCAIYAMLLFGKDQKKINMNLFLCSQNHSKYTEETDNKAN